MRHLKRAIEIAGSQTALARKCGVARTLVNYWLKAGVSLRHVNSVERATGGKVKAEDLWAEKRDAA